ncbi:kinesin protein [Salix suchowensis]|nr:kinesin protein [Salix suchowensis]
MVSTRGSAIFVTIVGFNEGLVLELEEVADRWLKLLRPAILLDQVGYMLKHGSLSMQVHKETLLEKPTLKFARSVSTIELGDARANIESSYIMQLKEKVVNLKKTLGSKEAQNRQFNQIQDHHLRFQK